MGNLKARVGKAKAAPKKTAATKVTQEPSAQSDIDKSLYQRNLLLVTVGTMTWQLALVVIVPIVGGYYLDQYFHTTPGLTIAGVLLAALGVVMVMLRAIGENFKK